MLKKLGFQPFFAEQMQKLPATFQAARVVGQHRREWDVATEKGTMRAVLAGRHWAADHVVQVDDAQPTVGDWVAISHEDPQGLPVIEHILERRSELARTSMARRGARQSLVANVDKVCVVAAFAKEGSQESAAKRSLHPRRLERYVTAVKKGGATPIIVLNKADLASDSQLAAQKLEQRLHGTRVVCADCLSEGGLKELLAEFQEGDTIALVGLSGVGKSSILNRLIGSQRQKIGEERSSDTRGRHTTTHRELFVTDDALCIIDTPGMREFALADAQESDLAAFSDIAKLAETCQFRDCQHKKEPGCQVRAAVQKGQLEEDRLESYSTLLEELTKNKALPTRRKLVKADKRHLPRRGNKKLDWDDE